MKAFTFFGGLSGSLLFAAVSHAVTIETVPVGNPGNLADTRYHERSVGSVGYNFRIGKFEVTNAQYVEFLNGVDSTGANTLALYDSSMTSDARGGINFNGGAANGLKYEIKPGRDNNPVVWVSWYDAIRFANWMHNGMKNGDTENGAFTLLGGTPMPSNADSITRNPGARWWLPSEDEWYKAAYHKNDGVTGNYWDYPTATNTIPYSDQPPGNDAPDASNTANVPEDDGVANGYNDGYAVTGLTTFNSSENYLTDVGAYASAPSPYGTFDQAGNVLEWNVAQYNFQSFAGLRGARWNSFAHDSQAASASFFGLPVSDFADSAVGFRVATIPEASTIVLIGPTIVGWMALGFKSRRRRVGSGCSQQPLIARPVNSAKAVICRKDCC